MKKYLISLEKDQKRRELFFSQPDTEDFEIFNAINTMSLSQEELEAKFDFNKFSDRYGRVVTKGEIGCTLSHLSVYQLIIDNDAINDKDYVLICEDDALFSKNFSSNLTALLNAELKGDMILIGQSKISNFDDKELELNYPSTFQFLQSKIKNTSYRYCYPYKNYFAGTVAYLIKKSACRSILKKVANPIDVFWLADDFILFGNEFNFDIKIVRPLMVIENPILNSNLESLRGSLNNNLFKKVLKYPLKKILAIKRNL